jgi:hypothetical protein
MDSLWEKIKQSLIDSASVAAEKAEYLGKLGRARLDIAETRHTIRDRFADLGGLVYGNLKDEAGSFDPKGNENVKQLIQTIDGLEDELSKREETLNRLRTEQDDKEEAETA